MATHILLLSCLILLNGLFAMSEIAIVGSRRARLARMAAGGSAGASAALALSSEPTRFLSSVQVGITTIGILSGAIGEASIAVPLRQLVEGWPAVAPYAETISLATMVVALTLASLIFGELVPKRLALTRPEAIASVISRPMDLVARLGRPAVRLLTLATDGILRLFGVRQIKQPGVTADEIRLMLEQGAREGVFERSEQEMMTNVLDLDVRHVGAVLTPRSDVVYLDVRDSAEANRAKLRQGLHTVLPLCDGGFDRVLGFVRSTRILAQLLEGRGMDLRAIAEPALFVPQTMTLMKAVEQFKRVHLPAALVVDEFGDVEGLVSWSDVVSAIVGELPTGEAGTEPDVVRREDGSWLLDGGLDLDALTRTLEDDSVVGDADRQHYYTLGGLAMWALGRVPKTGDVFERGGFRFEIVDVDGNRVDRVLASRIPPPSTDDGSREGVE